LGGGAWPIVEPIGRPQPTAIATDLDAVKKHINTWASITTGQVIWESVKYRATSEAVKVPHTWQLNKPTEWIAACRDNGIQKEFEAMTKLVSESAPAFHSLLIKRRSLWQNKPVEEVIKACQVAAELTPGYARGKPLRTLSLAGIDTKFFERHARLVTKLLDSRFEDEVSTLGLETFLDALQESDHWVLLLDLDTSLLPFKRQRVSTTDLANTSLPGRQIIIVENESCVHQLPALKNTVAILGAGLDLEWTRNPTMQNKAIAYWGDIDTWGLQCLARARNNLPDLVTLMMDREHFDKYRHLAVIEPVVAGTDIPDRLDPAEQSLYKHLLNSEAGRLEQEFLPVDLVHRNILDWNDLQLQ